VFPQCFAIRAAHRAIREQGESRELLGILVRGYANLGQLTGYMWSGMPKAFSARSLLYAHRMLARWPDEPGSHWHCAYAAALAGLQGHGIDQLNEAARLAGNGKSVAPAPPWVQLVDYYCHYETRLLGEAAEKLSGAKSNFNSLAQLMVFLTLEACNSPALVNSIGDAFLTGNPECYRVMDRMIDNQGVSRNHQLTVAGPAIFMSSVLTRLPAVGDLPKPVRVAVRQATGRDMNTAAFAKVAEVLCDLPAEGEELPWRAIGHLIRETQFIHVERRIEFLHYALGVSATDEVNALRPLFATHRYHGLIELWGIDQPGNDQLRMLLNDAHVVEPCVNMNQLYLALSQAGVHPRQQEPGNLRTYYQWAMGRTDCTSRDFEYLLRITPLTETNRGYRMYNANELHRASPDAPLYMASIIEMDWPSAEPQVATWQQTWGDHPILSGALGKQYAALGRLPEAEKYLRLYLAKAPDSWAYTLLANVCLWQNHEDQWLAALKEGLTQPDNGLDHATYNATIAAHYMIHRQFTKARPYANEAAGSYSSWGLLSAARCEEGLGNYDLAEDWIHRDAERYNRPLEWYMWCVRTGKGDRRDAEVEAFDSLRSRGDLAGREAGIYTAIHDLVEGKPTEAERQLRECAEQYNDTWSAMHVVLLRDGAGDIPARDRALSALIKVAAEHSPDPLHQLPDTDWVRPPIADLARLYSAANAGKPLDPAAVDQLIDSTRAAKERLNIAYFAGRIFALRGDKTSALKYLKRAAAAEEKASINCALAWIELRALGFDPAKLYAADSDVPVDGD
jgi:tetratricopeptide (TPR) repeat protein